MTSKMMPHDNAGLPGVQKAVTGQTMQLEVKIAKFSQRKFRLELWRILIKSPKETVIYNFRNKNTPVSSVGFLKGCP